MLSAIKLVFFGLTRFIRKAAIISMLLTGFTQPILANDKDISPQQIDGVTKVNAEGVIEKVSEIPSLVFIDARIKSDRMQGHIEGSISLPDEQTNCKTLEKLIPTHTTPVLFYCNGPRCGRSVTSSRVALKCGYSTIYWFRGGIEEWKKKKFPLVKNLPDS